MSDQAAALALAKLRGNPADFNARSKVVRWLQKSSSIKTRVDESDLEAFVQQIVGNDEEDDFPALLQLRGDLESASGTTLIAVFPTSAGESLWHFGPVRFGPLNLVIDEQDRGATTEWDTRTPSNSFAFCVEESTIGVRGSGRALDWLRAAIGALYLAARLDGSVGARLGPMQVDELAPTMFIGPRSDLKSVADALNLSPTIPLNVDRLLRNSEMTDVVGDCLQPRPDNLVQRRLRLAAPWLQCAFDSLTFPDAILSLGVALEALIGSEGTADVVRTIAIRTAFLLRSGETSDERTLSASDWRDSAARLYGSRSVVAHGRYEPGLKTEGEERRVRDEFEDLVCQVAARFRSEGKSRGWAKDADLKKWQETLELG
jgi:hypothetical protein